MSKNCETCGQRIREIRAHHMNKHLLSLLQAGSKVIMASNVNDFRRADLDGEVSDYTNLSPLRYFGLIHRVKKDGVVQRGHWLITRNGWTFLRGEIEIPKYIKVRDNTIESRAEETVHVRDVYRGSEAIATTFEYFDHETGEQIGWHPVAPKPEHSEQSRLFDMPTNQRRMI